MTNIPRSFDLRLINVNSFFASMSRYDPKIDLKINVGHLCSVCVSMSSYAEDYLVYEHQLFSMTQI